MWYLFDEDELFLLSLVSICCTCRLFVNTVYGPNANGFMWPARTFYEAYIKSYLLIF